MGGVNLVNLETAGSWDQMSHWVLRTAVICYGGSTIPSPAGIQLPESPFLPASAPALPRSSWAVQPERPGEWHCKARRHVSHRDKIHICLHAHQVVRELFYKVRQHEETVWQREKNKVILRGCQQSAGNSGSPLSSLLSTEEKVGSLGSLRTESRRGVGRGELEQGVFVRVWWVGRGYKGAMQCTERIFFFFSPLLQGFSVEAFGWVTVVLSDTS